MIEPLADWIAIVVVDGAEDIPEVRRRNALIGDALLTSLRERATEEGLTPTGHPTVRFAEQHSDFEMKLMPRPGIDEDANPMKIKILLAELPVEEKEPVS